jgi:flagellar biosynthetic protein FliR/FlhB
VIDTAYFLALFLIFLRITSYFVAVQIFFPSGTPQVMQGVFALILSFGIVSSIDYSTLMNSIDSNYIIMFYAVSEIMTGLILGYIANLIFQVVRFAGAWMDIHAGFSMVSILDPTSRTTSTMFGNLSYFVSLAFFFIVDGHHVVINMLAESVKIIPIGKTIVYQESLMGVMQTIFDFFTIGVKMAIPMVLIIVITDVCLGLISRTVPTIPIMILGLPVKNMLGIITYIVLLPVMLKLVGTAIYNLPNIFQEIVKLVPAVPIALIFASDDKTEEATPKKASDARSKGQIARSKDVSVAVTMIVCTMLISSLWGSLTNGFKDVIIYFFQLPMLQNFDQATISNLEITVIKKISDLLLPFALSIMLGGIVINLLQTRFLLTKLRFKSPINFSNPLSGMKNIFSKRSLVNLFKNMVIVSIVAIITYNYMIKNYTNILSISNLYLPSLGDVVKNLVVNIFKQICLVLVIIAIIDYFYQVRAYKKDMRMTKQEVKDEYKQSEGDPKIKGKIKQKQREIGMRRMMKSVADATVVITNPTHLAIALKYEEGGKMEAPKVVAKGADYVAFKIKMMAKDHEVPVIENKPLARIMYDRVEIDDDIPQDLYQGVAEILAVVMRIKKK